VRNGEGDCESGLGDAEFGDDSAAAGGVRAAGERRAAIAPAGDRNWGLRCTDSAD
jgi:hypothetical protein